jgi:hypothetical protein
MGSPSSIEAKILQELLMRGPLKIEELAIKGGAS